MIFNSFTFLFIFLPTCTICYFYVLRGEARVYFLIFASFIFYGWSGIEHALSLILLIIWVYYFTIKRNIENNKLLQVITISGPAFSLIYFKYSGFIINEVLPLKHSENDFSLFTNLLLPAGISFFTFQLISFAIDRYRGGVSTPASFAKFTLYIRFFPQLVAGPIVRFFEIASPLARVEKFLPSARDVSIAIRYVCIGLALKVLLAGSLHHNISPLISNLDSVTVYSGLFVIFGYSFQIYFDFFGYSLIAIGLARLIGFELPSNFDRPYLAEKIRVFWQRWHKTLSYWIRDYLYIPLGGKNRYKRNILIVFLVCGIWHGAGWNFIAWGGYHGFLVCLHHSVEKWWILLPKPLQILITFILVSFGWLSFLFDFSETFLFIKQLTVLGPVPKALWSNSAWLLLGICFIVGLCIDINRTCVSAFRFKYNAIFDAIQFALLGILILFFIDRSQDFIYFRF